MREAISQKPEDSRGLVSEEKGVGQNDLSRVLPAQTCVRIRGKTTLMNTARSLTTPLVLQTRGRGNPDYERV